MLRLWHRTFARRVKKEEKKGQREKRGLLWKLTFRFESVEPAVPLLIHPFPSHSSQSRRKTDENLCAEKGEERVSHSRMKGKLYPHRSGNVVSKKGEKGLMSNNDPR